MEQSDKEEMRRAYKIACEGYEDLTKVIQQTKSLLLELGEESEIEEIKTRIVAMIEERRTVFEELKTLILDYIEDEGKEN